MERWEILARLYNHAKPLGLGFLYYDPTPMSEVIAKGLLKAYDRLPEQPYWPDYLKGRLMKIKITEIDKLDGRSYEIDNGVGSVMEALTCPGCSCCLM